MIGRRIYYPIIDVAGELFFTNSMSNPQKDLLLAAVNFIERAEKFNARVHDAPIPPIIEKKCNYVYFSLIFSSNEELERFLQSYK